MVVDVPRSWAEVTPAWLGAALGRPVSRLRVTDHADGTNARARVTAWFAGAAEPTHLFVKREGRLLNRLALTALRAREAEADLARCALELPLEHPAFLAGAVDRRRLAAIVVMEDVTARGARPHRGDEPLSADQVEQGLAGLARLHAAYWNRPLPPFVRPWHVGRQYAPVAWAGLLRARQRLRALGRPLEVDLAELERGFRAWAARMRTGPQTLLHGDPHPGNTYAVDGTTGFYDWQLVRRGAWVHDVGYFVTSALSVADRRAHERDLLAGYLDELARNGVPRPADAEQQYRAAPVYGLGAWLQTLAAGTFQPLDTSLATVERFAAAYRDLR
ncbi:MAG TPA: phosphotransferase [Jatrophihabitans sp.]|nr:phosphotransferase [Jatrophihabitans sp.]